MIRECLAGILLLFFFFGASGFAQEEDMRSIVDNKVNKMKQELNLTDSQVDAVRPIIKDYLIKRDTILQETSGQGIVDHVAVKGSLKALKDDERQKLSKILSDDQMQKWINKENLMATLNPDGAESRVDEEAGLTAEGANFKF